MKFYSTEEYAQKNDIPYSTVRDHAVKGKVRSITVTHGLPNLIVNDDEGASPHIISFLNLKGGCGKTTISTHVAILLAKLGFEVLLIDTDHQNQCRLFFPEQIYKNSIKKIFAKEAPIEECIYRPETDYKIDIIYSEYSLALASVDLTHADTDILKDALASIKDSYDFIILDTSPAFDIVTRNVIEASTHLIVPVIPNKMHVEGLKHSIEGLRFISDSVDKVKGILANQVEANLEQPRVYLASLGESFPALFYENHIPKDAYLSKIPEFSTNIYDFREKSKGSQALKKVAWELLRRV